MREKILKTQLLVFSIVTVLAIGAFYFSETLPDNFLRISSGGDKSFGFFTYYVSSLIGLVSYLFGPWLFFPFLGFVPCYAFLYAKREFSVDLLGLPLVLTFFGCLFFMTAPELLGVGLYSLMKMSFPFYYYFIIAVASLTSFMFVNFRANFRDHMISFAKTAMELTKTLKEKIQKREVSSSLKENFYQYKLLLTQKIQNILRGQKIEAPVAVKPNITRMPTPAPVAKFEKPVAKKVVEEVSDEEVTEDEMFAKDDHDTEVEALVTHRAPMSRSNTADDQKYFDMIQFYQQDPKEKRVIEGPDQEYFSDIISRIETKLGEFDISGKIVNILKGPVVDTFELMLGAGVKINKITSLSEDLSLALFGSSIRVVYPMKGRATVGIEVPRSPREIIYLDDVVNSQNFADSSLRLPVAMGKDSFGEVFVVDLAAMPHMLVAGATGSGKSVFVNTLLVSLLVKRSPSQMKLVLIDPKQLELALYSKLPHLIMPVVTDHKKASVALIWAVQEMERRYSILRELGVRNIEGFNLKLQNATPEVLSIISKFYTDVNDDGYELPYIVIVVDEFADLILTKSGKEIETNIARLAAKARAAGLHIVLATQRPSVDVITGTIKSNFPTRVSFKVTTGTDSRTILNALGAEKLLGKGDMLYKYGVETVRVHSAYVDETEIEVLTSKLDNLGQNYNQQAVDFLENDGDLEEPGGVRVSFGDNSEVDDGLYEQAVNIVMEHRSASASMLQRRLKIGYNRAANLVEIMELRGVVGPAQGSKPRRVISGGASIDLP